MRDTGPELNRDRSKGRHVRFGIRQSIPSSIIDSCAGVSLTSPSADEGQTNLPFSKRLENMHAP